MKLNLFSTPVFIINIDTNKIIKKNGSFKKTWLSETSSSHAEGDILEVESSNYLLEEIGKVLAKEIKKTLKISLDHIWENRYEVGDFQERHNHPGSHFSFIIYKEIEKSNTVFFRPDKNLFDSFYDGKFNQFNNKFIPECRSNQIIIFPSCIEHMVLSNTISKTIACNLIIKRI